MKTVLPMPLIPRTSEIFVTMSNNLSARVTNYHSRQVPDQRSSGYTFPVLTIPSGSLIASQKSMRLFDLFVACDYDRLDDVHISGNCNLREEMDGILKILQKHLHSTMFSHFVNILYYITKERRGHLTFHQNRHKK